RMPVPGSVAQAEVVVVVGGVVVVHVVDGVGETVRVVLVEAQVRRGVVDRVVQSVQAISQVVVGAEVVVETTCEVLSGGHVVRRRQVRQRLGELRHIGTEVRDRAVYVGGGGVLGASGRGFEPDQLLAGDVVVGTGSEVVVVPAVFHIHGHHGPPAQRRGPLSVTFGPPPTRHHRFPQGTFAPAPWRRARRARRVGRLGCPQRRRDRGHLGGLDRGGRVAGRPFRPRPARPRDERAAVARRRTARRAPLA